MNEPEDKPTPDEAAAALRAVRASREQVLTSLVGPRWVSIFGGLLVLGYAVTVDLAPTTVPWLTWVLVVVALALFVVLRTRVGGSLLGRSVAVSGRSLPSAFRWNLPRVAPVIVLSLAVAVVIPLLHVPHAAIYYGALAAFYIIVLGPRFQLWLLRRQEKD
ncbi:hypothetical protein [Kutzneria sp. NPDC052558]|uniref:hypothetical protein n=1 Tax=Kutzneria sp. NPDC052558 TaxID=3364121 RepID=UPI0037C8F552